MDSVRVLVDNGVDLNLPNNDGVTPLMLAASHADKDMLELLIASGADPSLVADDGSTAFSIAASTGRRVIEMIISEASLQHAIFNDNAEDIVRSIHDGAPVDLPTGSGWTALIYASAIGNVELLKVSVCVCVCVGDGGVFLL